MRTVALVALLALTACAKSESPTSPSNPAASTIVEGQTMSALDGTATAGLSVTVGSGRPVTTDSTGSFRADGAASGELTTVITGSGIVERRTAIVAPTSTPARLPLIPASFDLKAFDEMARTANARLQRWTAQPSLVVLGSVMSYKGIANEYAATSEQLSDEEVSLMVAHLAEGLRLLTGGRYQQFTDVRVERPAAGEMASVLREGKIVAGRYDGIASLAQTIGYGTWAEQPDGTVVGGSMFLDHSFDRDDEQRRLLRIHELGHALGYTHVTSRASVMNPSIGPEPTAFDTAAAVIAFQRPPGNTAPDTDPAFTRASSGWTVLWAAPVACTK
jgi:hypothetical protein